MMKVFVSQPMRYHTLTEILIVRQEAKDRLTEIGTGEFEIVNPVKQDYSGTANPLQLLAESLMQLAEADAAYFAPGWERARGCQIERICCEKYGICIINA